MAVKKDADLLIEEEPPPPPPFAPSQNDVLMLLFQEMLEEKREKKTEKDRVADERNKFLLARAQGYKEECDMRERKQAFCNHLKEDGRTRIGGQRLSNGHVFYLCGLCSKEYDETTLPPGLHPQMEVIGG